MQIESMDAIGLPPLEFIRMYACTVRFLAVVQWSHAFYIILYRYVDFYDLREKKMRL